MTLCACCKKPADTRCGRCHDVFYCERECQLKHWGEHKVYCRNKERQRKEVERRLASKEREPHLQFWPPQLRRVLALLQVKEALSMEESQAAVHIPTLHLMLVTEQCDEIMRTNPELAIILRHFTMMPRAELLANAEKQRAEYLERSRVTSKYMYSFTTDHNSKAIVEQWVDTPLENLARLTIIRRDLEIDTRLHDSYLLCRIISAPFKVVGIGFIVEDPAGDCIFASVYNTTMKEGLVVYIHLDSKHV
jgi:hypothetical protein